MKNHWRMWGSKLIRLGFLATVMAATTVSSGAQRADELDELSFEDMLISVDVGAKSKFIQEFQNKEAKNQLLKGKYDPKNGDCNVEFFRNKEVLVITIPAKFLFDPNEVDLKTSADEYLRPIKRYLKNPDTYRVLLVMHTDNTGTQKYRDELTVDRVNAVFDWFEDQGSDTSYLFPYAMGDDLPLPGNEDNDSQSKRDANRRLEIYLMPGTKMLEQAKKGRIEF